HGPGAYRRAWHLRRAVRLQRPLRRNVAPAAGERTARGRFAAGFAGGCRWPWLNCGRHIALAAARRAPQNRAGGRAAIANPSTALPPIAAVCAGTLGTVMDDHLAKPFRSDHLLAV